MKKKISPYERVLLARDAMRPKITDYIEHIFSDFIELSGDRLGKEDASILGGIALLGNRPVTVIGHRKGRNLEENLRYNFGMPGPEGYRKALRLMKQAEKFGRPVITFIDTPGAYPGMEAEENGQSIAIAENLAQMSTLKVPVICVVTGEGNSGGALAIGVGDSILMLENAVYAVLSPEGFASILWKDSSRAKEACDVMKMTAEELYHDGLINQVIPEPEGGIQTDVALGCEAVRREIVKEVNRLSRMDPEELVAARYEKYRYIEGDFSPVKAK